MCFFKCSTPLEADQILDPTLYLQKIQESEEYCKQHQRTGKRYRKNKCVSSTNELQQEEEIEGKPIDYKRLQRYRYIDSVCQATVKSHLDPY